MDLANNRFAAEGGASVTVNQQELEDMKGKLAAIDISQAVIEFELDGTIITANKNFLDAMGYQLHEIRGHHHRMFVDSAYAQSDEYRDFWQRLAQGDSFQDQFMRIGKGSKQVWLQASYNPVFNADGKPVKVIKFATDITAEKVKTADLEGQIDAIGKSQAVIEFDLSGNIRDANENFLNAIGYSLNEIQGQHHRMFVVPAEAKSPEYKQFWEKLARGEFASGQFKRIGKGGREVWLQANYNPIFDPNGKPFKVVKYASDITEEKLRNADYEGQLAAIGKAQAVIEFELDGTIRTANENFLNAVGYTLGEVQGKHHRIFVDPEFANTPEYSKFWQKLGRGEYDSGQYKRIGKNGNTVWLQANYNPIFDPDGNPFKVVKYASDITAQKDAEIELQKVMDETTEIMNYLSEGNLTHLMQGQYSEKYTTLKNAINGSINNLYKMVEEILEAVDNISSASSEIAQGNSDLSQRTEEQASSLEETASSMEELTSTVKQNADNSMHADKLSSGAREKAEKGGSVVGEAIKAMSEINKSSKQIADIIGVIDEIAFQTNLLALNAAVEAARAGEQGRGFAVVAAEVRNLAQRSASAAKEIKALIKDSVDKVEQGSKLVNESGTTLEEIVNEVKKVSDIIADISAASLEQASGIEQVNKAVMSMDEVTQQNAALVEEAAAASESLDDQAVKLEELMTFFKMDEAQ